VDDPGNPGSAEVAEALITLVETEPGQRPFRMVVSAAVEPLLQQYNDAAEQLRPIVAGIFNVPELAAPAGQAASMG
jgi:hypothetical protein